MSLLTEYSYTITNNWVVIDHWEAVYVKIDILSFRKLAIFYIKCFKKTSNQFLIRI